MPHGEQSFQANSDRNEALCALRAKAPPAQKPNAKNAIGPKVCMRRTE
jgi:hypothetical protein